MRLNVWLTATLLAVSSPLLAGDCGGYANSFAQAPSCSGAYRAPAPASCGGPYSSSYSYSYSYASPYAASPAYIEPAPLLYTAPYSVVPVSYSFAAPAPQTYSGCDLSSAQGLDQTLSLLERLLGIVDRLSTKAPPPQPEPPSVAVGDPERRLQKIETFLKSKYDDFQPADAGRTPEQPPPPPGAASATTEIGLAPADAAKPSYIRLEEALRQFKQRNQRNSRTTPTDI